MHFLACGSVDACWSVRLEIPGASGHAAFENTLSFSNHLSMFSEEISNICEQLRSTPQAFSHLAMISAAFNLERVTKMGGG